MGTMPDEACEIIMKATNAERPNDLSLIHCERLGGKIDHPDDGEDAAAFSHRGALFWLSIVGTYSNKGKPVSEAERAKVDAWCDKVAADLEPFVVATTEDGKTVGTLAGDDRPSINTFGQQGKSTKVARLVAAKAKYDPDGVFQEVWCGMSGAHFIDPKSGMDQTSSHPSKGSPGSGPEDVNTSIGGGFF